ncbi:iron-siderophore ABC transporter substrate-binding protein [Amphibacillus jilinensis]|uniref:ABC transporter substrate-binding protein n=1 Tax=Amphibacillus jilinensis TaxID=1216008 RepID=UPI0002FA3C23|nr:iron-siderophore ABC transporter substrate-binding protein [Amphibacillus jilinensis]
MKKGNALYFWFSMLFIVLTLFGCSKDDSTEASSDLKSNNGTNAETQLVTHELGEIEVPKNPERIVVLGLEDMMLSLEAPIQATTSTKGQYLHDALIDYDAEIIETTGMSYSFEAILAQEPDLILVDASHAGTDDVYERLTDIAPTLAFDREDWETSIQKIAEIFEKEDKANQIIENFNTKLAEAKEQIIEQVGENKTVAFIRPSQKDVQLLFPGFAYTRVLYDNHLGLEAGPLIQELQKQEDDDAWGIVMSFEKLPYLEADYLFVTAGMSLGNEEDNEQAWAMLEELTEDTLWQSIPAVKSGHVYTVSSRHWMLNGPIADSRKIDDVLHALTNQ